MFKPITLNILAILVLGAATFMFFKNKDAYELEIVNKEKQAGWLDEAKKRLADATKEHEDTVDRDNEEKDLIAELEVQEEAQKKVVQELKDKLRDRTNDLRFFEDNQDIVRGWSDKVRIAENSMDEIKVLDKEIKELNTMISNRETNLANLTDKDNGLKDDISNLKAHILSRTDGRSIDGLKSKVRAVYNSWGFVTLADGDKNGVVLNSTLDVMRDDEVIAKLLVTIVEQDSASADIVPGSMAPDTFLMIGDLVVPAKASTGPADPDAPEGPGAVVPGDPTPAENPADAELRDALQGAFE